MNYILFDDQSWKNLLPLTFTKPVSEVRIGILKISEKWEKYLNSTVSFLTRNYLSKKYVTVISNDNILINGSVIPNNDIVKKINQLKINEALVYSDVLIAVRLNNISDFNYHNKSFYNQIDHTSDILKINQPWEIFKLNGLEIESDFKLLTHGRKSCDISNSNHFFEKDRIFIEDGAKIECAILNPAGGYIYIGKDAEVMEGSIIRGSFALCEHSVLKLGAKIYGPTTIGPHSKVGGEVNNSVIFGCSNKAHDGFLGNSVLGEWCNIGADSNNSNLKNNYEEVKLWNYEKQQFIKTGLQFCGLMMGDHSKCGINTMFNTGTVVGVSANIFGAGFPRNYIPSFSWGGATGFVEYQLNKALETAQRVMERRNIILDHIEKDILSSIYEMTKNNTIFN